MNAGEPKELGPPSVELKWVVSARRALLVRGWLARRLRPDPEHAHGVVVSLYYDTPDWRFIGEKRSSDYLKTKVRVRWYEDESGQPLGPDAFLEVKGKFGRERRKLRLPSPVGSAEMARTSLEDPRLRALPEHLRREGLSLPAPLLPVFTVRYRRTRWVDPLRSTRVCLDDSIHVGRTNRGMVPGSRRPHVDAAVIEIKGSELELPPNLRFLVDLGVRRRAFSKYAACHELLTAGSLSPVTGNLSR